MAKVIEIPQTLPTTPTKKRVAAYCRVSNPTNERYGSLESQPQYYTELIDGSANWINAGVFAESASGLNTKDHTQFRRMMTKCRRGHVDLILTKSISRFGRNTLEMLQAFRELRDLNIDVYFEVEDNLFTGEQTKKTG